MSNFDLKKLQNGSDIRGIALSGVPGETPNLTCEAATLLTYGFCEWLSQKTKKPFSALTVSVGHDPRLSAQQLKTACINAMTALGIRVLDCGLASTPAMFFSTVFPQYRCDGAVMITASHLPENRNGFKYFDREGGLNKSDITDIIARAEVFDNCPDECDDDCTDCIPNCAESCSADCAPCSPSVCGGSATALLVQKCDLMDTYCAHLQDIIKKGVNAKTPSICSASVCDNTPTYNRPLAGLKIVVDAGNGAGGFYASRVLAPLGADVSGSQFLEPDGHFPNHAPNPEDKEAMHAVRCKVLETGADLGLIFDTDVDRSAAVDENGREIARNGIVALAAALISEEYTGTTIVTDSITSDQLSEFLTKKLNLSHLRFQRGYKNVINKAIALNKSGTDCQLAIETSGHAAFKENYFLDDGAYLAAKIVIKTAQLARSGKKISCVIKDLQEPEEAIELRFPILADNFTAYGREILSALEAYTGSCCENEMMLVQPNYEGVRIRFAENAGDGWCLLRISLHDPIMPLNIESNKKGGCRQIAERLRPLLSEFNQLDISKL